MNTSQRNWTVIATLTTHHEENLVAYVNQSEDFRFSYRIGYRQPGQESPGVWTPVFVRYHPTGAEFPHLKRHEAALADLHEQINKVVAEAAAKHASEAFSMVAAKNSGKVKRY